MNAPTTTLTALSDICEEFGQAAADDTSSLPRMQVGAFRAWLERADPGASLEYHRGFLICDRGPESDLPQDRRSALARVFLHAGVKLNSIALEFTRSGAAAATINAIAQGETRFGTTQGGTPTSLTFSRISQFQGSIKRAGSPVGNLTGGSVTYSNNLEKIETIRDDGLIEGADPTIAALTGRIDVRFADTTLIDLAAGGSPVDLEFAYMLSTQAKLVLTAHEVYLPKPKLAVEGPGGVQASFDFRGAKSTGVGRMLTVTLTNDLDGLVYG